MPIDCPEPQLLSRLLTGDLSPGQEQQLSRHLEQCAACRHHLERLAAGERTLHDVARNLRGKTEMSDALKRVIDKCTSDPLILLGESAGGPGQDLDYHNAMLIHLPQPAPVAAGFHAPSLVPGDEFSLGPGSRLGAYEILDEIGRGGMGVVWKGRDPLARRLVAIKVLDSQVLADKTARQRFLREARAVAAVSHRNVVAMYAVEESPIPYLVMEFVDGPSLRSYLAKKGLLDQPTVLRIGLQVACGLAASHARGITHRDIKPGNIVIEKATGRVKLTDFGLAQIDGDPRLTRTGFVAGTPAYMSPEQARGEAVDYRSDLFSLGTVLYVMATGQSPFGEERTVHVLERVSTATPVAPRTINPDISAPLAELIGRLHSRHPDQRPDSAAEVAQILKQLLTEPSQPIPPAKPKAAPVKPVPRTLKDPLEPDGNPPKPPAPRPWWQFW